MRRYLMSPPLTILLLIWFVSAVAAAGKPEIVSHTARYLDRSLFINLQWQSASPVILVRVSAGQQGREIRIEDHENRRLAAGYSGEVSVQLPVDATLFQREIPYVLQLEDESRSKGELVTGSAPLPVAGAPFGDGRHGQGRNEGWGREHLGQPSGARGGGGDITDRLLEVSARHDVGPSISSIEALITGSNTVLFRFRANDDKQLREITLRIFDDQGRQVQTEKLTGLGRIWEGSTRIFRLSGGSYRVIVQAVDSAGTTSKEAVAAFMLQGGLIQEPAVPTTPAAVPAFPQIPGAEQPVAVIPAPVGQPPAGLGAQQPGMAAVTPASGADAPVAGTPLAPVFVMPAVMTAEQAKALRIVQEARSAGRSMNEAAQLLMQGGVRQGGAAAQGLAQVYGATAQQAAAALKTAGFVAAEVVAGLRAVGMTSLDSVLTTLQGLGYGLSDVLKGVVSIYGVPVQTVVNLLKGKGFSAAELARALQAAYGTTFDGIAQLLLAAGYPVTVVADALKEVGVRTAELLARTLRNAGVAFETVAIQLARVFSLGPEAVVTVLKGMGIGAQEMVKVLAGLGVQGIEAYVRALKGAGYLAVDLVGILARAGFSSAETIGRALKAAGFPVDDIARGLRVGLQATGETIAQVLVVSLGMPARAATAAMQRAGVATQQIVRGMKALGHSAEEIAEGLVDAGLDGAADLAQALKNGGFGSKEVAKGLKRVGKGAKDIAKALKSAGWSSFKTILDALRAAGISSIDTLKDALKAVGASLTDLAELF